MRKWWGERRHASGALFVLSLMYMPICSASLHALDCYSPAIDGVRPLRSDLRVVCGEGQHVIATVLAYVALVVIGLGFPLTIFILLGSLPASTLSQDEWKNSFGWIYDGYRVQQARPQQKASSSARDDMDHLRGRCTKWVTRTFCPARVRDHLLWAESFTIVRKLLLAALAVTTADAFLQIAGALLVLIIAAFIQLRLKPFSSPFFNFLELGSLVCAILTCISSAVLLQSAANDAYFTTRSVSSMSAFEWAITVSMAIVNFSAIIVLASSWLKLRVSEMKGAAGTLGSARQLFAPKQRESIERVIVSPLHTQHDARLPCGAETLATNPPASTGEASALTAVVKVRRPTAAIAAAGVGGPSLALPLHRRAVNRPSIVAPRMASFAPLNARLRLNSTRTASARGLDHASPSVP